MKNQMPADAKYFEAATELGTPYFLKAEQIAYRSAGDSMYPFLKEGDELSVIRVLYKDLRLGDLITYQVTHTKNTFITHRFLFFKKISDSEAVLIAKGDNRTCFDEPIASASLVGKVAKIMRAGRPIQTGRKLWRLVSCLMGILSLTEGFVFQLVYSIKRKWFKNFKIRSNVKMRLQNVEGRLKKFVFKFLVSIVDRS